MAQQTQRSARNRTRNAAHSTQRTQLRAQIFACVVNDASIEIVNSDMQALRIIDTAKPQKLQLADDIATLHASIAERDATIVKYGERTARQEEQIEQLLRQVETLQQQFLTLRRMHFGATSERLAGQAELFSGTVSVPVPAPPELEIVSYKRAKSNGRPRLPKDLPRQRIDYDLSEAEKAEFDTVTQIGEEVSETLEYTRRC